MAEALYFNDLGQLQGYADLAYPFNQLKIKGVKFRERKIPLSNLFNNLQKERGELAPLSHFQPIHWQVCHINPAQYKYPISVR